MATPQTYTVKGHWPFPLDMLRRDQSVAATPTDQASIDRLSGDHTTSDDDFIDIEISLVSAERPSWERWESFGWQVVNDPDIDLERDLRARFKRREIALATALAKLTDEEKDAIEWHLGRRFPS